MSFPRLVSRTLAGARAKPAREKRKHVKSGLRFGIAQLGRNRAGTARGAGAPPAVLAGTGKMPRASGGVVGSACREGSDRAGRQTGPADASLAGMRAGCARAEVDTLAKPERPAIGMPETPLRKNEQAERRAMDRLGLQCPCLEVQERRATERIMGGGIQRARQAIDQPLRPSIERMGQTVAKFRGGREGRPLVAARPSQQHDGRGRRAIGKRRRAVQGLRVKGAPERKAEPVRSMDQPLQQGRPRDHAGATDWPREFRRHFPDGRPIRPSRQGA